MDAFFIHRFLLRKKSTLCSPLISALAEVVFSEVDTNSVICEDLNVGSLPTILSLCIMKLPD